MNRSERYLEWCNQTNHKELTNTQVRFVEFLFKHEEELAVIGILDELFIDVHSFIKNNPLPISKKLNDEGK